MTILISAVVYKEASRIIQNEMMVSNEEALNQTKQSIDKGLNDIQKFILYASFNKSFRPIIYEKNVNNLYNNYDFFVTISDLDNLYMINGIADSYYVYLKNSDRILSSSSFKQPSVFFGNLLQKLLSPYNNLSYEQWYKMLNQTHKGDYIALPGKESTNLDKRRTVLYMKSMPTNMGDIAEATIVFSLNNNLFTDYMQDSAPTNIGWRLVIDESGQVIFSNLPSEEPLSIKYDMLKNDTGLMHYRIDGKDVMLSYTTSSVEDWKYVSIIPTSVFGEKIEYVKKLIIISIVLSLFLGGLIAYFFSRRNYGPINDLIQLINSKNRVSQIKGYNEYRFLKDIVSNTLDENEKKNLRLKQQNIVLQSNFLTRLLKGKVEDNKLISNSLETYNIQFESDNFAVMLFYIKDFNMLFKDGDDYSSEEKLQLVKFIITNVVEELVLRKNQGLITEVDQMLACIISFNKQDMIEAKNDMIDIANEAREFISKKFHIDFMVSASSVHKTYIGISVAYQEALSVMEYKQVMNGEDIISYEEIKTSSGNYNYPIETEHQLINYIKTGDFENARATLNEVFVNNYSSSALSNEMVKCLLFDLTSTILKTMPEISSFFDNSDLRELDIMGRLLKCDRVHEMKQQIEEILKEICLFIQQNKKGKKEHLIENVIQHIENNYFNADLSVSDIAGKFELTAAYLTRLFKEQTGEGIFDYITKVRIEKAKQLLKNQQYSIKDVTLKVGYYSSTAFIRTFKKYEGITPGSYKDMDM